MKKIVSIFILIVISRLALAQCIPCTRHSQTDPANPVPGTDPCMLLPTPPYATNEFDWMQLNNSPFHLNYYKPVPFANPLMNPFYNHNNGLFALSDKSDFRPDQGWELIKKDLGYLHNGSPIVLDPLPIIYIILYNRFNGKLRILADASNQNYGNLIQKINVYIELINSPNSNPSPFFDPNLDLGYTALLSGVQSNKDEKAQTLDSKTKVTSVSATAIFPSVTTNFFYADFQMAYDVCTCVYESGLKVSFEEVQTSTFQARGRLLATNKTIDNTDPIQHFLSSVYEDQNSPNAEFFNQTYQDIASLKADLNKAKASVSLNYLSSFSDGLDKVGKYLKLDKIDLSSEIPDPFINTAMGFIVGESGIDKISTVLDFFSSEFGDSKNSNPPDPQPTIIQGSVALTGKITSSKIQDAYSFYLSNPGSKKSEDRPEYYFTIPPDNKPPYTTYNEVLGTFAVLKACSTYQVSSNDLKYQEIYYYIDGELNEYKGNWYSNGNWKSGLTDNVLYTYNQALNIVKNHTIISAAIMVDVDNSYFDITPQNMTLVSVDTTREQYISPYVSIECIKDLIIDLSYRPNRYKCDNSTLAFGTDYYYSTVYNPDDGTNTYSGVCISGNYFPIIKGVYLKIIFIPEYQNSNTTLPNNHSTQLFTYNVNLLPWVSTQPDFSEGKVIVPVNIDLNIPTTLYSSSTTVFAQNDISINGNLTTSGGAKVKIIAGHQINVNPDISIDPNITLDIGSSMIECNTSINPQLDGDWLFSYCKKTNSIANYHGNEIAAKKSWFHDKPIDIKKQNSEVFGISFNPFPNPSKNNCAIDFTLKKDATVSILISDVSGKEIYKALDASAYKQGHFSVPVNMDLLDDGIYFCTFTTADGYNETKKIVVLK